MISYLSATLVLIGLVIHVAALAPLRRLIAMLPAGAPRDKWHAMTGLIFIFIAGYLGYLMVLWGKQTEWNELLIPGIFLFGALFVWLTIELSQQTAADLRRMEDELLRNEKLALLGNIADTVGHELRNPLSVMNNAVYFLQTVHADADETTKEYLGIIKEEIADAERIVSDLLDAVRTKTPHPEMAGVAELIRHALRKSELPATVTVKLDIPENISAVRVDPLQMHQVLWNLICNGVEAMPEGGALEIGAVENPAEQTVTIRVKDSGGGMTAEQLGHLFQPLFTTKARGIGLGLVVVKNLVEVNGGSVEVQSEPGNGTTLTVTLPAADKTEDLI